MSRWLLLLLSLCLSGVALGTGADFTLNGLDGRKHSLSDYRGKWVVVNYWATWCPPCLEEMPDLVHFHEAHKNKDAVVLGVNMEEASHEHLAGFIEDNLVTYPILRGEPDMVALGPIDGLPTTYLVAPDGTIVAHKVGVVTGESIESFMASYKPRKK
jgi:thiol-disulfide isomerase/thioredoxin